jgi:predicted double-glycine peptidase
MAVVAMTGLAALGPAQAADVVLGTPAGNYDLGITSWSEIPFKTVIHQRYDYSCGSAALATLLKFHYAINTDEAATFKQMFAVGDQASIRKLGFSLLDMKRYLESLGYIADGFRVPLSDLEKAHVPAIALVQIGTYKHFVVIKGIVGNHVLVGDPATGLKEMKSDDFLKIWNGIAFVIHDSKKPLGSPSFNSKDDWARWADAHPLSAVVLSQSLAPFTRDLRVMYQIEPNQILPNPFQP